MWAYITTAPPNTAIHHQRAEGWKISDKIAAEILYGVRELLWRYTAVHFVGGTEADIPEPIQYPGRDPGPTPGKSWETVTLDEMVSPEVRAFLKGA